MCQKRYNKTMEQKGIIFDIQRFSTHDGPGIRTTVFFKGCSAGCKWCHNPESVSFKPQLQYYKDRCTNCGKCAGLCLVNAHNIIDGKHDFNRNKCTACGICSRECFNNALVICGRKESTEDIMASILADKSYYNESKGGVTLSGGEPVLQDNFCMELLKQLKSENIHTNLQTAGFYPFEKLEKLLPYLDLITYDIKGVSPEIYKNYINADPALAVENLKLLDKKTIPFIVRTPCIKNINDSEQEIEKIAQMLFSLNNLKYYMLVPYHGLAKIKYDILGRDFIKFETPPPEHMKNLEQIAAKYVTVRNNYEEL